jgi:hypothetical protein
MESKMKMKLMITPAKMKMKMITPAKMKMKLMITPANLAKQVLRTLSKTVSAVKAQVNKVREIILYGKKKEQVEDMEKEEEQQKNDREANYVAEDKNFISAMNTASTDDNKQMCTPRNPSRTTDLLDQTRQSYVEDIDKSADAYIKKIRQQWTLEKQQEMLENNA